MHEQSLHILLVEDNPTDVLLLTETLEEVRTEKFVFTHAIRLDKALQQLHDNRFDVVLLDLGLPDSQGLDTFARMQREHPELPILILSGLDDDALAMRAVQDGAQDFLVKGKINGGVLARTIRYAIERKRTEQTLISSEISYRRLFETAQDGIFILDADTRQITDANPYLQKLLGYTTTDFIGKRLWEIAPFRDKTANKAAFLTLQQEDFIRYDDLSLLTRDGKQVDVEFISNIYKVGSRRVIQCNIRDISERKQAEAAKQELQRFLQSTLDALASHIAVLDEEGTIVAVNKAWQQFSEENEGTAASCAVGANYLEVCGKASGLWAEEAPEVVQGIRDVMTGRQQAFCLEYPCHSPNEERWFNVCVTRFAGEGPILVAVAHENITQRKQADEAMRAGRELNRSILESSSDCIKLLDMDENILSMNGPGLRLMEVDDFGMIEGQCWSDFWKGEAFDLARAAIDTAKAGGHGRFQGACPTFKGTLKWWDVAVTPIFNEQGQPVRLVSISRDITDLKKASEAMARLASIVESSDDAISSKTLDGIITTWNAGAQALYGYSPQEAIGRSAFMLIAPDRPDEEAQLLGRIARGEPVAHCETVRICKDGRDVDVSLTASPLKNDAGEIIGASVIARDISDRKRAEAALQRSHDELELRVTERTAALSHTNAELESEIIERQRAVEAQQESYALLHAVTEGTTDCIFVKDLQGRYLMINSAGARRRRKTVAEILGKVDTDLFSPETARIIMEADRRVLAADATQTFEETTVEDGVTRTHLVTKGPHRNPRGEVIGIVGIARDVTARKQQEDALRAAKEEADTANLAKSEFLSRMSHELRTPLNAILGFGQILDREDLDPLSKESVGYILKGGRHLLDLINEVLDIARVEAGHAELSLEPIALDDIVPEACALVRPLATERNIRLGANTAGLSDKHVLADRQRLKQVLINLLSNAIKYNRESGQVEIACGQKPDGWTFIAVHDTGPGISPQDLPKLFTPFERLNASTSNVEGTGLGLALSQQLVKAMGGTLNVESVLGRGTTFTIELPQATAPQEQLSDLPAGAIGDTSKEIEGSYSLLCIEDNPSNLRLIEAILRGRPEITLLAAVQGSVGLDLARQHEPDLILLDLNLPDIHGSEVLARLQQSALTRDIPVVVISADATPHQVERLLGAGARDYLTKPLNVAQFLLTLDKFLHATPESETDSKESVN